MSRKNNFDLIRLFAALQVLVWHLKHYLGLTAPSKSFYDAIKFFPGVPIFFVISGFLIFASYDRNKDLVKYFKNRILRIFPGLWVAFFVLFALVYSFGFRADSTFELVKWIAAQLTVFQTYTPPALMAYINNDANPSLWTIRIEFEFYIAVPIFFWLVKKLKIISMTWLIVILMILSYGFNYYLQTIKEENFALYDALDDDLFPLLFYFLAGVLSYLHFDKLKRFYVGKGMYWLALYLVYAVVVGVYLDLYEQAYFLNGFGLIGILILSQTIISMAFTRPELSHNLLKGNDISYGVYLYHLIVVGVFFRTGFYGNNWTFFPVMIITIVLAYLSWIFVEKPALDLKNTPLTGFLPFRLGSRTRNMKKV